LQRISNTGEAFQRTRYMSHVTSEQSTPSFQQSFQDSSFLPSPNHIRHASLKPTYRFFRWIRLSVSELPVFRRNWRQKNNHHHQPDFHVKIATNRTSATTLSQNPLGDAPRTHNHLRNQTHSYVSHFSKRLRSFSDLLSDTLTTFVTYLLSYWLTRRHTNRKCDQCQICPRHLRGCRRPALCHLPREPPQ